MLIAVFEDSSAKIGGVERGSAAVRLLHRAHPGNGIAGGVTVAMGIGPSGEYASSGSACTQRAG